MKRWMFLCSLLTLLAAVPAVAQVPSTISYQGVLTDNLGNIVADGLYNFTFKVYDVPSAGVALWTETQVNIQVTKGGFNVILGSVTPLALAFDKPYYLGVAVGASPEMTPRVALASSPYGLSLRLPFSGTASTSNGVLNIRNTGGGAAIVGDPRVDAGTTTSDGVLNVFHNGAATPVTYLYGGGLGGGAEFFDATGSGQTAFIEPDVSGTGAFLFVSDNGSRTFGHGFIVDGNDGSNHSVVYVGGWDATSMIFNTGTTGDGSVVLPANSIDANEILDEPGVAQGHANGSVGVPVGTTMGDIVTVTITTPAAGYIVVQADAQHGLAGSATASFNYAACQIDETAGGGIDGQHYFDSGFSNGPRNFFTYTPVSLHRTYFKAAGTYTFRFEAYASQSEPLSNYMWNPTITATFYPTSYGTVTAAPALAEQADFSSVQQTASEGNGPGSASVTGQLVDLRELELKAAHAKALAETAERQLLQARLQKQMSVRAKPAAETK